MTIQEATARIAELEKKCRLLQEKLYFLEYQPTLAAGIKGETLVSLAVDGAMTVFTAGHDVSIVRSGITMEVKFSNLGTAVLNKPTPTKRWTWARPLGGNHTKRFDRLILVGDLDVRFSACYKEQTAPYVFFDVPFGQIASLMRLAGTHEIIQITTNPRTSRTPAGKALFENFQVSFADLSKRYGFVKVDAHDTAVV